jgi:uncharacterized protein (UPF0212 family)
MKKCSHPFGWKELKRFRHYHPINEVFGGKCPKCKSKYDTELLGSTKCPDCNVNLKPTYEIWSEIQCLICGEIQTIQGILK